MHLFFLLGKTALVRLRLYGQYHEMKLDEKKSVKKEREK